MYKQRWCNLYWQVGAALWRRKHCAPVVRVVVLKALLCHKRECQWRPVLLGSVYAWASDLGSWVSGVQWIIEVLV